MPFDSNGTFTRIHNWENDRQNDIDIVSDRHDEEDDGFADGLSQCLVRDGRAAMSGDLNMGGFQIKNLNAGTSAGDAVNKQQYDTLQTLIGSKASYKVVDALPSNPEAGVFYFVKEQV